MLSKKTKKYTKQEKYLQLFNENQTVWCVIDFVQGNNCGMIQLLKYGNFTFHILLGNHTTTNNFSGEFFIARFLNTSFDDWETTTSKFTTYLIMVFNLLKPFDFVNVVAWCSWTRRRRILLNYIFSKRRARKINLHWS